MVIFLHSFEKFHGKFFLEQQHDHNMTMIYPNLCFNKVCCKGTALYLVKILSNISVSPYESGIIDLEPTPKIKRGLTLMCKIMQNIANHVQFTKENHMRVFNEFLKTNFEVGRR